MVKHAPNPPAHDRLSPVRGIVAGHRPSRAVAGDDASRFGRLVRQWRRETGYVSSAGELLSHPALREIVAMGLPAVPLIVGELQKQPDWLLVALGQITGENPVSDADRGDLHAMAGAWIAWFHSNLLLYQPS